MSCIDIPGQIELFTLFTAEEGFLTRLIYLSESGGSGVVWTLVKDLYSMDVY